MEYQQEYNETVDLIPFTFENPLQPTEQNDMLQQLTTEEFYHSWDITDSFNLPADTNNVTASQPDHAIAGFILKLYKYLQSPDDEQKHVRWCKSNGTDMFIIDCIPKFTETVLPQVFKHCKFASFVRQLNIYGFRRDTDGRKSKDAKGKYSCRWYHAYFNPGRRDLLHLIRRKSPRYSRTKKSTVKKESELQSSPEVATMSIGGLSNDDTDAADFVRHSKEDCYDSKPSNDEQLAVNSERRPSLSSASSSSSSFDATLPSNHRHSPCCFQLNNNNNDNLIIDNADSHLQQLVCESPQEMDIVQHQQSSFVTYFDQQLETQAYTTALSVDKNESEFKHNTTLSNASDLALPSASLLQQRDIASDKKELEERTEQLQETYSMYKTLKGEVKKAHAIIEAQRSRIEFLERLLLFPQQTGRYGNNHFDNGNFDNESKFFTFTQTNRNEIQTCNSTEAIMHNDAIWDNYRNIPVSHHHGQQTEHCSSFFF
ncbi:MAG: HSF-type DNA-binding-domain-containing protein [Benjaminiella poitrasii]|nr:MAG: HSF-type DNA-binding-domain-containing protein [Benjaminiella poitrasii]